MSWNYDPDAEQVPYYAARCKAHDDYLPCALCDLEAARPSREAAFALLVECREGDDRLLAPALPGYASLSVADECRRALMGWDTPHPLPRYAADGGGIVRGPGCAVVPFLEATL